MHSLVPLTLVLLGGSGSTDDPVLTDDRARLRAHYATAEAELRATAIDDLDAEQRAKRSALLDALRAYRERGDFGIAPEAETLRALRFVDDDGRRCAVAELLHVSGRDDLVREVAATDNAAFVHELAAHAELRAGLGAWLEEVGLTLDEAARIQGPARGTGWGRGDTVPPQFGGPGEGGATGGAGPRPRTGGPLRAPRTGEAPRGPVPMTGPGADSGPVTPDMQALLGADWWSWWEFAKVDFLGHEREGQPVDDAGRTRTETLQDSVVRRVLPLLSDALADDEAAVRRAAAISFGRLAGSDAVAPLRALLDDSSLEVREAALLALGATGSEAAAHLLLQIAHERDVDGLDRWRDTEELSVLALGILRARDAGTGVDGMLPRGDGLIEEARLLHHALTPSERLAERARETSVLFTGKRRPDVKRKGHYADVLAIEALREDDGDGVLEALLRASAERDVERRRAAITTLGTLDDVRADGPLRTAFETESDTVSRGLALIAIANVGAEGAGEFLVRVLQKGRSVDRPWAALAIGVHARERTDAAAEKAALRRALGLERSRENRRALALGLGIARDSAAVDDLLERLRETNDAGSRVAYGYALGLIGDPRAAVTLRAAIAAEKFALVRAELAQALGTLRIQGDEAALVEALLESNDPDAATQAAGALSFHGRFASVTHLVRAFEDAKSPAARSAALLAIGLVLDQGQPFAIASELRDRNPFVAPDWFLRAVQTTL